MYRFAVFNQESVQEIELTDGRFSVGQNDDIRVAGLAQGSLTTILCEGVWTILTVQQALYVDGKLINAFPIDVGPRHMVTCGDYTFSFSDDDSAWPAVPELQVEPEGEAAPIDPQSLVAPVKPISAKDTVPLGVAGAAVAVFVMLGLFVYGAAFAPREVVDPRAEIIASADENLRLLLDSDPVFDGVLLGERLDGALVVTGLVEVGEAFDLLSDQSRLEEQITGGFVRNDAMSPDSLERALSDMLVNYPVRHEIQVDGDAHEVLVSIRGVKTSSLDEGLLREELSRIQRRLDPWLMDLAVELVGWQELQAEAAAVLQASPVTESFELELVGRSAVLTGRHALSSSDAVKQQVQKLEDVIARYLPVERNLFVESRLGLTVDAIVLNDVPYALVTDKGRLAKVAVGDRVAGRAIVRDVDLSGIRLELSGSDYFLPLKGAL